MSLEISDRNIVRAEAVEGISYDILSVVASIVISKEERTAVSNWLLSDFPNLDGVFLDSIMQVYDEYDTEKGKAPKSMLEQALKGFTSSTPNQQTQELKNFFQASMESKARKKQLYFLWVILTLMKNHVNHPENLDFASNAGLEIDNLVTALTQIFAPVNISSSLPKMSPASLRKPSSVLLKGVDLALDSLPLEDPRYSELVRNKEMYAATPSLFKEHVLPILQRRKEMKTKTIVTLEPFDFMLPDAPQALSSSVSDVSRTLSNGIGRMIKDCLKWIPEDDERRAGLESVLRVGEYTGNLITDVLKPIIEARAKLVSLHKSIRTLRDMKVSQEERVRAGHLKRIESYIARGNIKEASGVINALLTALYTGKDEFTRMMFEIRGWQKGAVAQERSQSIDALLEKFRMGFGTKVMLAEDHDDLVYQYPPFSHEVFTSQLANYEDLGELEYRSQLLEQFMKDPTLPPAEQNLLRTHQQKTVNDKKEFNRVLGKLVQRSKYLCMQYRDQHGNIKKGKDGNLKWVSFHVDPKMPAAEGFIQVKDENGRVYAIRQDRVVVESVQTKPVKQEKIEQPNEQQALAA